MGDAALAAVVEAPPDRPKIINARPAATNTTTAIMGYSEVGLPEAGLFFAMAVRFALSHVPAWHKNSRAAHRRSRLCRAVS